MDPLCQQVRSVVLDHLQAKKPRLLVAVSGGLDSMVLLHVLRRLSETLPLEMGIAHFDHQLRGRASARDAAFVRESAEKLGLPVFLGAGDVRDHSRSLGISLEMAARKLRYAFLSQIALSEGFRTVATAHHANDQVELFFIRLLRGAGGDGFSGMPVVGGFPGNPRLRLIRPMLGVSRRELEAWGKEHQVKFREDGSNQSRDILRNRVRHELLPVLASVNGSDPAPNILRSMELVGAETEFVEGRARDWLEASDRVPFDRLSVAIQRQVVRIQLLAQGEPITYRLVESLRCAPGDIFTSPVGVRWTRSVDGRVTIVADPQNLDFLLNEIPLSLVEKKGAVVFAGRKIEWEIRSRLSEAWIRRGKPGVEVFDAAKVGSEARLRHWHPGDRFQPLGLRSASKLQDLFVNQKVPVGERRHRVICQSISGSQIFWVEGLRVSDAFKVGDTTRRFLVWKWRLSGEAGGRP